MTDSRAHFFFATSIACSVDVTVYAGANVSAIPITDSTVANGSAPLLQFGQRLWMGVVEVDVSGLSAGQLVSYNAELVEPAGTRSDLYRLGLLGQTSSPLVIDNPDERRLEIPLGYEPGVLPCFVIPPDRVGDLHLVHASCRKPHGGLDTEADAMQAVDAAIAQSRTDTTAHRPQQLILTGDQIYADDVAASLLVACTGAGEALLGWDEPLPMTSDPVVNFLVSPGWRTRYLAMSGVGVKSTVSGETYDYSANHLLRFAEWVAMYVFAWSDALYERDINDDYELPGPATLLPDVASLTNIAARVPGDRIIADIANVAADTAAALTAHQRKVNATWDETSTKVLGYAGSCRNTRRVLANVATYTMFDDHEITDDWYLSKRVHDELKGRSSTPPSSEVGPRLLRNGLSAYAFFQHWGNVPDDFASGTRGAELLDLFTFSGATAPPIRLTARARDADGLLDIGASDAVIPRHPAGHVNDRGDFTRMRWDYAIAFPAHRLIALDTRTWRHFPTNAGVSWTDLAASLPEPAGDFATTGLAELQELVAEWTPLATAAGSEALQQLGALINEVIELAEAIPHGVAALGTSVGDNPQSPPPAPAAFIQHCAAVVHATYEFVQHSHNLLEDAALDADDWLAANEVWYENNSAAIVAELSGVPVDFGTGVVVALVSGAANAGWGAAGTVPDLLRGLASIIESVSVRSTRAMLIATAQTIAAVTDSLWTTLLGRTTTVPGSLANHINSAGQAVSQRITALPTDGLGAALMRDGNNRLGVGLISQEALEFQVTQPLETVGPDRDVTVMLSPAPIFGNNLVELAQRVQLIKLLASGQAGEEEVDFEPWTGNVVALRWLFEAAASASNIVVLSGDVHYAGSSVNRLTSSVTPGPVVAPPNELTLDTNYIQLTSSASRNSDAMTRGLALLDDLLYTDSGEVFFIQGDFTTILQGGSSSLDHLANLAGASVERSLLNLVEHNNPRELHRRFAEWWETEIDYDAIWETIDGLQNAPLATLEAMTREASWRVLMASHILRDFASDPIGAVLGDFLTAGPLLRQQLQRLFVDLGIDPEEALSFSSTVLVDRRPNRVDSYPVRTRLATLSPAERTSLNGAQRRTVGHANAGFISFTARNDQPTGLIHEIRWYPHDVPPAGGAPPPRTDWYGTVHEAGWQDRPAGYGVLLAPDGIRPARTATCWNPTVHDLITGAVAAANRELADWDANPAWRETTTAGGRRVQDYWLLFTASPAAKMALDSHGDTEHWSAAFISWCFARAYLDLAPVEAIADDLDPEDFDISTAGERNRMLRQARRCLGDRGYFSVSASHYGYFTDTIGLDNTNAAHLSPTDAVIQLGDLVYAGRSGTTYDVHNGRLRRTSGNNFFSHADLVIDLGSDATGDYAIVVGGNVGDRVATKTRRLTADGRLRATEAQEAVMRLGPAAP